MKKTFFPGLFLSLILTGCTHYYYVPSVQNVPLLKEKKEFRASVSYSIGEESRCAEIQSAYAVTDKIGIMADFMTARGGEDAPDRDWGKGIYLDGAAGYFKPVKEYGVFEIYGGMGWSRQDHNYMNYTHSTSANVYAGTSSLVFTKFFIQPSYGFTFKPFDIAVSSRINLLYFNTVENNILSEVDSWEYEQLNGVDDKTHLFFEPAITLRAGWEVIKIQLQAATASYLNNSEHQFEEYHFSIGLSFDFASRYNTIKP
jgi:hypothetical protein